MQGNFGQWPIREKFQTMINQSVLPREWQQGGVQLFGTHQGAKVWVPGCVDPHLIL